MVRSVLIATATQAFGLLIKQTLEESGRYQAFLVDSAKKALDLASQTKFDLYILDHNLPDMRLAEMVLALREADVTARLMVVPPDNQRSSPALAGVAPDGYLTKPFYLPDLMDMIDAVVKSPARSLAPLLQGGRYKQIVRRGPRKMILRKAAASHRLAAQSLSPNDRLLRLARNELRSKKDAKARTAQERSVPEWLVDVDRVAQLLTRLSLESAAQAALIVHNGQLWAYAGELSQPAGQELAKLVAQYWGSNGGLDLARFVRLESNGGEYMLYATGMAGGMVLALVFDVETPFSKIRSQASSLARKLAVPPGSEAAADQASRGNQVEGARQEEPVPALPPLYGDVPPPTPRPTKTQPGARAENDVTAADTSPVQTQQSDIDPEAVPEPAHPRVPQDVATSAVDSRQEASSTEKVENPLAPDFESGSLEVCSLKYACLLLPRLPQHHLTGEIAASLAEWMPQLCLAFGWRLEYLSIRPEYLHWVTGALPSTPPGSIIEALRQHTSLRMFSANPHLSQDNPSGDFWAPGYLMVTSAQPLPAPIIQDFIWRTRRYQGAARPVSKPV